MGAMSRIKIQHGTRNTYERHKCRCEECRTVNATRHHTWVSKNRERNRELSNASYALHRDYWVSRKREAYDPVKNSAREAVKAAILRGEIVRGDCESEGDCSGQVQAHHDDYVKQLDVRWLCRRHHRLYHLGDIA